jgi:purine-binding chemotaxis protein CheW
MGQWLTFTLGSEHYGIDIMLVQEIRSYAPATRIPNAPGYVTGVMNLRGAIVPLVDLGSRVRGAAVDVSPVTAVVVVAVREKTLGLIVDSVTDVTDIDGSAIQPVPDFGGDTGTWYLTGMAQAGDRLIGLLDAERVVPAPPATVPATAA